MQKGKGRSESTGSGESPELTTTLYHELRHLAVGRMAAEPGLQTLDGTALVHEAWLRLGGDHQPDWANRAQFFSAAAEAMRRILIDRARHRKARRHGGGHIRIDLDATMRDFADPAASKEQDVILLSLHEALDRLSAGDPETADLVKLRYFIGMTTGEAAEALGLTRRTAERRLQFARAWLSREMKRDDGP